MKEEYPQLAAPRFMAYYRGDAGAMAEAEFKIAREQEFARVRQHFMDCGACYGPYKHLGKTPTKNNLSSS
jgi:hypothetical protein